MANVQQLVKRVPQGVTNVSPITTVRAVKSEETGYTLDEILASFNMLFLPYNVNAELTRLQVPNSFRRGGLWVTYVTYDETVVTEWYNSNDIDDNTWKSDANWRLGSNMLVGDISISSEGNWVINGVDTGSKAQGESGITPMIRVNSDNHLEVSYTNGSSYIELSDNPVFTRFRVFENKLQQSLDLGNTWSDVSDHIAAWFRWQNSTNNLGKVQISRDNNTWEDLSPDFINRMLIKGFVSELPQDAEYGDIYMVGPSYTPGDTEHNNPYYRMWVMQDTWVDAGDYNKNTYNYSYNIKKTYESVSLMQLDSSSPVGTNGIAIQIGEIVTVVNSSTPSENGFYSYEGADNGWKLQSGFNFQLSQTTGTNPNISMSQKSITDELNRLFNSFVFAGADLAVGISYINDYYIGSIGQLFSFVGYKTTDFILIKGQSQVEYIGAGHQSSVATCFYDSNKIFISSIAAHGNTTINVPANAYYLRTSSNKSTTPYIQIIAKQDYDISSYYNSEVVNSISKLNAVGVELVRLHDKNLTFSGFVVVNSSTPSLSANKAYIAAESGTIFGITNVQKGQIIIDNGTSFYVQSIKSLIDYYAKTQIDQFFNNFNLHALAGINAAANTIYTLGFITSVGSINTHTIYEYTDYIQILGQDTITVSGHATNSATYLCFYDKNKSFITGSAYAGRAANAILPVPSGAYYLRGTVMVGGSRLSVILNNNVDLAALKYQEKLSVSSQQIEDSVALSNSINSTLDLNYIGEDLMRGLSLITNFYISYSGIKYDHKSATYCISPTIKLNNVKKIRYKGHLYNNLAIGFYSSDVISAANLVGIIKSSDQANDYTIDINVPAGAKYMVASTYTDSITTLQLEIVELYLQDLSSYSVIDEQVKTNTLDIATLKGYDMSMMPFFVREYCKHIFNSVICIGDSITQGYRSTGVFLNESYPAYLSKITGWTVENSGVGGYTPISWYNNKFSLYNYSDFDLAIICLGQNNGLTDTIDADTASGDYNTYAATNTGQYCRIIEAIKAAHPDIKMMLLSRMDKGVNVTWNVVYKIGLKYNIPVISFVTNGIDNLTKAEYHPHSDTVHFGTMGNLAIANVVSKSIERYVYDNMSDFATYKE